VLAELAFFDLDGLLRTADLLTAVTQIHQHHLSTELAPVCDCSGIEAMLFMYNAGRYAVQEVICKVHNLL
jgi:hypothetical protein